MGGYGAFKLALSRPERYAAAAGLSGALDIHAAVTQHHPEDPAWSGLMQDIFGDPEKVSGGPHDLFALAKKNSHSSLRTRLFQYCGTEDFLYQENLHFRDFIRPLGFDYTYAETPGDHTWGYWDAMIQQVIAWMLAG